jgi:hypothetical protein
MVAEKDDLGFWGNVGKAAKGAAITSQFMRDKQLQAGEKVMQPVKGAGKYIGESAAKAKIGFSGAKDLAQTTPTADSVTRDAVQIAERAKADAPYQPMKPPATDSARTSPAAALMGGGGAMAVQDANTRAGERTLANADIQGTGRAAQPSGVPFPTVEESRKTQAAQRSLRDAKVDQQYRDMGEIPPSERGQARGGPAFGIGQRDPMIDINRKLAAAQSVFGDPSARMAERQSALSEIMALQGQTEKIGEQRG